MSTTTTPKNRKKLLNTVSINLGCSCKTPKLSSIFTPKPKPSKTPKYHKHLNSSYYTPWGKTVNSSSNSPYETNSTSSNPSTVDGFGRVRPKSVAVEKESNDPYLDFRQSMLQMIVENEIYSKEHLKELLNCFLQLNSPSLHGVIIRAFTEIWNGFFYSGQPNNYYSSPGPYVQAVRPKSYEV
ncbi:hypothetical protein RND81_01G017500 [Saponaria officinalis]|uniref:Transcription repressor n=1 Tax=Saponaria officinalis TaxID=3572 RepID=A0AAW1NBR1_SAPOF